MGKVFFGWACPLSLCIPILLSLYLFYSHKELFGFGPMVKRTLCFGFSTVEVSRYNMGVGFSKLPGDETYWK